MSSVASLKPTHSKNKMQVVVPVGHIFIYRPQLNSVLLSSFFFPTGQVMEHYIIPEFTDVQEFLSHLAKRTGKLKKGDYVWNGMRTAMVTSLL